eukprot:1055946-Prorocentrum_minimum.AAC.2
MDQSDALSTPAARRSAHTAAYRCHARAGYSSFRKRRGPPIKPLHHWRIQFSPGIFADTTRPCRALLISLQLHRGPAPPLLCEREREATRGQVGEARGAHLNVEVEPRPVRRAAEYRVTRHKEEREDHCADTERDDVLRAGHLLRTTAQE